MQRLVSAVFAQARLLLFPALSFDAAPRIIVEATAAGLPVITSNHGGPAEMLDGAGFLIDVAQQYRTAVAKQPDAEVITPWVEHLKLLWNDEAVYASACSRAITAARRHDLSGLARKLNERLLDLVNPLEQALK